ncbi:TerD family protein [Actinomadura barringtoniae]|uniref:TerD family protein n=1 Tax=Actinomadura barringtoniae TaxID=1427535 RepID=A0A939PE27_9ACTN|nr:TerD family protein [Actinomadura barringtoniae]MBO2450905.1 TerD family protein [Actinomadura barringtoniae]
MGFGFRVGVPGASVRVSTRGVRASAGPRIARVSVGSGGTRVSSGMGPFYASSSAGGRRRTSTRKSTRNRTVGPSPAQLERARRQAERAQQEAERDAAIAQLRELRQQTTSVHLVNYPPLQAPQVPRPPQLGLPWALTEARAFHLRGVGRFARAERAAATRAAEHDAAEFLAAEQARLHQEHQRLSGEADQWWQALLANDEVTVCEAVNVAFSDNPAAGCAVGVEENVLSIVLRQQDIDSLPEQAPGLTPSGRPTLKKLTKRDRNLWWLNIMGSNVIATLKEAFATAPAIVAIDLAVLTRIPENQRLGIVAYGRWSRQAVQSTAWRTAEDALRFLDLGQDVACAVTTTSSGNLSTTIKPLNADRIPGLQALLDNAVDESATNASPLAEIESQLRPRPDGPAGGQSTADPYSLQSFEAWKQASSATPPAPPAPQRPMAPTTLIPGQTVELPEMAQQGLLITFTFAGADADLTLLLTGRDGRVIGDEDFVFYNQPSTAQGAARLLGKQPEGPFLVERAAVHLAALPGHLHRVIVSINMDVETGLTCGALTHSTLHMQSADGSVWAFEAPADPKIRAMVIAELYRHTTGQGAVWKLRALGQGWADGLDGLARSHGVEVD